MTEDAVEKSIFEEATRCNACLSEEIYPFQDTDGGVCLKCKAVLPGPIKGGMDYSSFRRKVGLAPELEVINEKDEIENPGDAARKLKEDFFKMASGTPATPSRTGAVSIRIPAAPTAPERPKGPTLAQRAKKWLSGLTEAAKKPEVRDAVLFVPQPSKAPEPPVLGLPKPGEMWSIGPCQRCNLPDKKTGKLVGAKILGTSAAFVKIEFDYTGCFFCSKKL